MTVAATKAVVDIFHSKISVALRGSTQMGIFFKQIFEELNESVKYRIPVDIKERNAPIVEARKRLPR